MLILGLIIAALIAIFASLKNKSTTPSPNLSADTQENPNTAVTTQLNNLSIDALKKGSYPGSDIVIEQTLDNGSNYKRYIASYKSENLKIFGLLTVPDGAPPKGGFPAIIFNHGFIPPAQYVTTQRYVAYQDGFAKSGYVTFKSDYRGHGNSEGTPSGAYGSNAYTIDVLNATTSVEKLSYVNPNKIGMWGHSMGGFLTLRALVVRPEIKASVIWGGVVASYPDMLTKWTRKTPYPTDQKTWRGTFTALYGTPEQNPTFWNSISATSYLSNITGPMQLDYGGADEEVPPDFSKTLYAQMKNAGKTVEIYEYPGDDHNISHDFNLAEQRSIDFFNKYLK